MIILNHKLLQSEKTFEISKIEDIKSSPSNSTILFNFSEANIEICNYCNINDVEFAIRVESISEILLSANLNAKYIFISDKNLALKAQKIADNYMYDSKIILEISSDKELQESALNGIDGVVYKS